MNLTRERAMKQVRNFLCKTNPAVLAFWFILIITYVAVFFLLGPAKFLLSILTAAMFFGAMFGIGYGVFRLIKWLQGFCQE